MYKFSLIIFLLTAILLASYSCVQNMQGKAPSQHFDSPHQEMVGILSNVKKKLYTHDNSYCAAEKLVYFDSILQSGSKLDIAALITLKFKRAVTLLEYGDEVRSIEQFKDLMQYQSMLDTTMQYHLLTRVGLAYLRLAERTNCLNNHSADACILPIQGRGIHTDQAGSRKAIELFQGILKVFPNDLDIRWLLNISYMTLGEYPQQVPADFLIPGLNAPSEIPLKPFEDMAAHMGLNVDNMAGGVIVEDFDNDGYLDIVTSAWGLDDPMHFFRNNGDGTFSDQSIPSGLHVLHGGLNMVSADYNNDGFVDIFVLRGGWQGHNGMGEQPNSLIRNNGDGTFTDVTTTSGVLSFMPTQTATWNDFNLDGWLDLYIGNEMFDKKHPYPCELYLNNQDGTFTNVAKESGADIQLFVKGVTSGDYDNDGWPDIFLSTQDSTKKVLLRNKGTRGKIPTFENVSQKSGIDLVGQTFGTWFWDYDNDGWLDLFLADYDFERPLSYYAAREALSPTNIMEGKMYLYRNNQDGTFSDVTRQVNLDKMAGAMGHNFGDLDNDGWLDFYLGTGNPNYQSLVPNKLFRNMGGKKFADVTTASRMGHLQKGHGIAFADMDNDGDQDIYAEMGGAYRGDHYPSSFYLNPGQNSNKWISIQLEGTACNKNAVGARIEVKFREKGVQRSVFRDVNTGGSFGCSPHRREIGIGQAAIIDELIIRWPTTGKTQSISKLQPNQFIKIIEGQDGYTPIVLNTLDFKSKSSLGPMCKPDTRVSATQ